MTLATTAREAKTAPPHRAWPAVRVTSVSRAAGTRLVAHLESTSPTGLKEIVIRVLQALTAKLLVSKIFQIYGKKNDFI